MSDGAIREDAHAGSMAAALVLSAMAMLYAALVFVRVLSASTPQRGEHGSWAVVLLLASVAALSIDGRPARAVGTSLALAFALVRTVAAGAALARGAMGGLPGDAAARLIGLLYAVHSIAGAVALARPHTSPGLARAHWTALAVWGLVLTVVGVW